MTTFSIRPVTEDQTDSPYVDVIYTLEEEEENVTDYQEGGFGSVVTSRLLTRALLVWVIQRPWQLITMTMKITSG